MSFTNMEDNHNHNHGPSNGFLMGVIVGAAATLLFTTKKGREIVKEFADKGFERMAEWEDTVGQEIEADDEDDYVEPVEVENLKLAKESTAGSAFNNLRHQETQEHKSQNGGTSKKGKANFRRFFKGSKKG